MDLAEHRKNQALDWGHDAASWADGDLGEMGSEKAVGVLLWHHQCDMLMRHPSGESIQREGAGGQGRRQD